MRVTQALLGGRFRNLRITTKDVNKGFYKGNRTGAMGRHTKYGGYVVEWDKVRTYMVPQGLADFKLTPYVSAEIQKEKGDYEGIPKGPMEPKFWTESWKSHNGID